MEKPMRLLGAIGAFALALAPWSGAHAQDYPSRAVRIVVPYAAGGSTDILTRLVAQKLGARLGQVVFVENKPGANGVIGTDLVAKSAPDGYTMLMMTNGQTINVGLNSKLPFDTEKDFVPLVNVAVMPNAICIHPSHPAKTLREFVDAAIAKPGMAVRQGAGLGNGCIDEFAQGLGRV